MDQLNNDIIEEAFTKHNITTVADRGKILRFTQIMIMCFLMNGATDEDTVKVCAVLGDCMAASIEQKKAKKATVATWMGAGTGSV